MKAEIIAVGTEILSRSISSRAPIGTNPGRLDSAPTSMMSAVSLPF